MLTIFEFTTRLAVALLLGAIIGVERQWRQKSAGLRTNTLVSLGAAAYILLSIRIGGEATGRVASYIISGIGFLGAGVIMKDGLSVQGLNTAATIWCSAAVGSLSGMGLLPEAGIVAAAIILAHLLLRPLGSTLSKPAFRKSANTVTAYLFTIRCKEKAENHIRVLLMQHLGGDDKLLLRSITSSENGDPAYAIITAEITAATPQDQLMEKAASRLTVEQDVTKVKWEVVGQQTDL
ncbi:MgtC/SapB family protein [Chitinophaga nivalis]|uniref:Protein MgtC n=1 Tax=Chitinophaga nivalis TaxID=2991709 RepID=A0ABT3IQA2_9BACT|nr:MgtC/SapB family protein [Chitinophaga nivalis]MCW3464153.1 MgtC/SapB family protein [Chitinophaga nivalis]MCW3486157.1 MgtC/SapB family protein [Chitinophaga nivalis]